jgi:hypothetical protein
MATARRRPRPRHGTARCAPRISRAISARAHPAVHDRPGALARSMQARFRRQ